MNLICSYDSLFEMNLNNEPICNNANYSTYSLQWKEPIRAPSTDCATTLRVRVWLLLNYKDRGEFFFYLHATPLVPRNGNHPSYSSVSETIVTSPIYHFRLFASRHCFFACWTWRNDNKLSNAPWTSTRTQTTKTKPTTPSFFTGSRACPRSRSWNSSDTPWLQCSQHTSQKVSYLGHFQIEVLNHVKQPHCGLLLALCQQNTK